MLVEHDRRGVVFGESNGALGFSPLGDAKVEEVTLALDDVPPIPLFVLHTAHFALPVTARVKVFSTPDEAGWPFELQLDDATTVDEMLHVRGPLAAAASLSAAQPTMKVLGDGQVAKDDGHAHWREWEYVHENAVWRQRLYAVALGSAAHLGIQHHFVVTAQCPADRRKDLFAFSDACVAAMRSTQR